MTLRSPENHLLRRLEGNPGDVRRYGQDLVDAGAVMRRTATQLKRISEGTRQIAESVDAVREVAGETYPDLEKAATRYERTGAVLKTYAVALDTAQTAIHPLIPQIEDAHRDLATARSDAVGPSSASIASSRRRGPSTRTSSDSSVAGA